MAGVSKKVDKEFNKLLKSGAKLAASVPKDVAKARREIAKIEQQKARSQSRQHTLENITIRLDPAGHFCFEDSSGYRITDEATIRRIKASPQFLAIKKDLEQKRQVMLDEAFAQSAKETSDIIDICKQSPAVYPAEYYTYALETLSLKKYTRALFSEQPISDEEILDNLKKEAQEKISTIAFWKANRLKEEYVKSRFDEVKSAYMKEYYDKIKAFEAEQDTIEAIENNKYETEFAEKKHELEAVLSTDASVISGHIQEWINTFSPSYSLDIYSQYDETNHAAIICVDLPELSELPGKEVIRLSNGNLKEKQKTQIRLKQEFATLAFGLAIYISSNVFALCANVERILISGYTQRRDKEGEKNDEYIYSIVFNRESFIERDFSFVDPISFCMQYPNRSNLSSTMSFKKISPYTIDEAIASLNQDILIE